MAGVHRRRHPTGVHTRGKELVYLDAATHVTAVRSPPPGCREDVENALAHVGVENRHALTVRAQRNPERE